MYTNKEQTEKLLAAGIEKDSCDMVVFAGRSKTDPYKDWDAVPKCPIIEKDAKKKSTPVLVAKEWMPVWSDEALFNLLPTIIDEPGEGRQYELRILKRTVTGRGLYSCVSYLDEEGRPWRAFMHRSLTQALCNAVCDILCSDKYEMGNFLWE